MFTHIIKSKWVCLVLSVLLAISIAGCAQGNGAVSSDPLTETQPSESSVAETTPAVPATETTSTAPVTETTSTEPAVSQNIPSVFEFEPFEDPEQYGEDTVNSLAQEYNQSEYLFFGRIFASQTYLFFTSVPSDSRSFCVYYTEDLGKTLHRVDYEIPDDISFDSAQPICCGTGGGSGECQFVLKLTSGEKTEYIAYNNFTWGIDQSYLEFRYVGMLDNQYAEEYCSTAAYKLQ